jgi:hypothetical protein
MTNVYIVLIIVLCALAVIVSIYNLVMALLPPKIPEHDEGKVNKKILDKIYRVLNRYH